MIEYEVTNKWFEASQVPGRWPGFLNEWLPEKVLEVGSYEGALATWLMDNCPSVKEMYCIDTWEGGEEHSDVDMAEVEARFGRNIELCHSHKQIKPTVAKLKGPSHRMLSALMAEKEGYFDLIYIDGSHLASDVLLDASLSIHLLRPGGLLIFDDYLWRPDKTKDYDNRCPKMAIDAFLYANDGIRTDMVEPGYQVFVRKSPV